MGVLMLVLVRTSSTGIIDTRTSRTCSLWRMKSIILGSFLRQDALSRTRQMFTVVLLVPVLAASVPKQQKSTSALKPVQPTSVPPRLRVMLMRMEGLGRLESSVQLLLLTALWILRW